MELKDFVQQALSDVVEGVKAARGSLGEEVRIGTTQRTNVEKLPAGMFKDFGGRLYSTVEFDVAVTTVDAAKGSGGINVLPFKIGGEVEGRAETASRIKFVLSLCLEP